MTEQYTPLAIDTAEPDLPQPHLPGPESHPGYGGYYLPEGDLLCIRREEAWAFSDVLFNTPDAETPLFNALREEYLENGMGGVALTTQTARHTTEHEPNVSTPIADAIEEDIWGRAIGDLDVHLCTGIVQALPAAQRSAKRAADQVIAGVEADLAAQQRVDQLMAVAKAANKLANAQEALLGVRESGEETIATDTGTSLAITTITSEFTPEPVIVRPARNGLVQAFTAVGARGLATLTSWVRPARDRISQNQ